MAQGWHPLHDLVFLQDRMNRLFEDATQRQSRAGEGELERADWIPAADVYESEKEFTIALDLPGIDRAALEISLDNDRLMIRGVRPVEQEDSGHRTERPRGRFLRRFGVPTNVDQKAIGAEYKDGVLRVSLPKRKEREARRVEIKVK